MTDAKWMEQAPRVKAPALACPLQLYVLDPQARHWPLIGASFNSSQLQLRQISEHEPLPKRDGQVLLLVDSPAMTPVYEELERRGRTGCTLIFIGDAGDTALVRMAMRLGAADFLPHGCDPAELWASLGRIAERVSASARLAPVTLVINGKAGSGASFVAANLGHAFSKQHRVALLDASLTYGSLTDYLSIKERNGSLGDAIVRAAELDGMALKGMMSKARDGLDLLPASAMPLHDDKPVSSRQCAQLLHLVRSQYEQVIVDMSRGPSHWNLPMIEGAERVLVVMQQSLAGLRETIYLLRQLRNELGIDKKRITLLVNRYDRKKDVALKEIVKATEIDDILTLTNDFSLAETCTDLGQLVAEVKHRHKLVSEFSTIGQHMLAEAGTGKKHKGGFFSRLLGRS